MANFPARQTDPGARLTTRDDEAGDVELTADSDGIVRPQTLAEHRASELTFRLSLADGEEPHDGPLYVIAPSADEVADPDDMTRDQLRARAQELGLPVGGTKAELAERIATAAADADQPEVASNE